MLFLSGMFPLKASPRLAGVSGDCKLLLLLWTAPTFSLSLRGSMAATCGGSFSTECIVPHQARSFLGSPVCIERQ